MEELGINHHPIKFGEVVRLTDEYEIRTYKFEDDFGQEADGCLFVIKPGGSTQVARITDPEFNVKQIAVKGSGWVLTLDPEGEIDHYEAGEAVENNPLMLMDKDWSYCWIANPSGKGLEVLNVSRPPFNPNVEIIVDFDDPQLPEEFWTTFHKLKGQAR